MELNELIDHLKVRRIVGELVYLAERSIHELAAAQVVENLTQPEIEAALSFLADLVDGFGLTGQPPTPGVEAGAGMVTTLT